MKLITILCQSPFGWFVLNFMFSFLNYLNKANIKHSFYCFVSKKKNLSSWTAERLKILYTSIRLFGKKKRRLVLCQTCICTLFKSDKQLQADWTGMMIGMTKKVSAHWIFIIIHVTNDFFLTIINVKKSMHYNSLAAMKLLFIYFWYQKRFETIRNHSIENKHPLL